MNFKEEVKLYLGQTTLYEMKSDTRRKLAGAMAALSIGAAGLHGQGKDIPKLPHKIRELTADELNAWDKASNKEKETFTEYMKKVKIYEVMIKSDPELKKYFKANLKSFELKLSNAESVEQMDSIYNEVSELYKSETDGRKKALIKVFQGSIPFMKEHLKAVQEMNAIDLKATKK